VLERDHLEPTMRVHTILSAFHIVGIYLTIHIGVAASSKGETWHMNRNWQSSGWQKGAKVDGNRLLKVVLAMTAPESGINMAVDTLQAVSDPRSARFGK
jgi:hypothetical protein